MTTRKAVTVKEMPKQLDMIQSQLLLRQMEPLLKSEQPYIVFDFTAVRRIDSSGVDMLLECMEAVMKRDGDLKLAAVPPEVAVVLEVTRVDRLFEILATVRDAVDSFDGFLTDAALLGAYPWVNSSPEGGAHQRTAG